MPTLPAVSLWLDDATLSGSAAQVREGVEARVDAGVTAPILVRSSTSGGQAEAVAELFTAYARPVAESSAMSSGG